MGKPTHHQMGPQKAKDATEAKEPEFKMPWEALG